MALDMMVAMLFGLLSHGDSSATAEEKEACLQRWGQEWVGPVDKFEALQLVWLMEGERF